MKKFGSISLLIILILAISINITACRSNEDSEREDASIISEENDEAVDEQSEEETDEDKINLEEESDTDIQVEEEETNGTSGKEDNVEENSSVDKGSSTKSETVDKPKEEAAEKKNTLKVEGNVGNELKLSLDELKDMEDIIFEGDFYSINNFGTTQHTHFKGANLYKLLEKAQISSEATKVSIIATDGYSMEFTVDQVKRQDYIDETNPDERFPMIIAWGEDGKEYDADKGPPYKLVVAQKELGDVNKPQWVSNIDRIVVE